MVPELAWPAVAAVGGPWVPSPAGWAPGVTGTVVALAAALWAVGLAAEGGSAGRIDRLLAKVERAAAGEDVSFDGGGDDPVDRLEAAVGRLADRAAPPDDRLARERARRASLRAAAGGPVARVAVDDAAVVRSVDDAFASTFGVDPDEAPGTPLFELAPPVTPDRAELRRLFRTGQGIDRVVRVATDRGPDPFLLTFEPVEAAAGADATDPGRPGEAYVTFTEVPEGARLERERHEDERYSRELYRVVSDEDLDDEGKIERLLEVGCERLGLDGGLVSRIDRATGSYDVVHAVGNVGQDALEDGPLTNRFCRLTVGADTPLAIHDAVAEGYGDDPAYVELGIASYLGVTLTVDDEPYGTLCFYDTEPREAPFSDSETAYVEFVARWVGGALERRERERERRIRDRAIDAAPLGVTITDRSRPDDPLVQVNDAFLELTGYDREDVLGRNCRFLQGADTDPEAVEQLRAAVDAGESTAVELLNYRADGSQFWNRVSVAPIEDDGDEVTRFVGFQEDVTERRRAERRFRRMYERITDGFFAVDADWRYTFVNEAGADILGRDPEDLRGRTVWEVFPDIGDTPFEEALRSAMDDQETAAVAARYEEHDAWYEVRAYPDEEGISIFFRDVTDRRERERDLERYRSFTGEILDAAADLFYVVDGDLQFRRWNRTLAEVTGYDDLGTVDPVELVVEDDREAVAASIEQVFETGSSQVEARVRTADGEAVPYEFVATTLEDPDGEPVLAGIGRDVSDRKEREQKLRERERRLERYKEYTDDVLDAVDDVFYVLDEEGRLQRWNDSLPEVTGYDDEEVGAMHAGDFFAEADRDRIEAGIREVLETGSARVEAPYLTADGESIPYEFVATTLEDPDGEPVLAGIGRDVSDRKERERKLREANERLNRIVEASPAAIVALDLDGTVRTWNRAAERIFGWSAEEVLGESIPIVPEARRAEFQRLRERYLAGESVEQFETERLREDGSLVDVSLSAAPLRDDDGEVAGVMGMLLDITERKASERELRRTRDLLAQAQQVAKVGAWEVDATVDPMSVTCTDGFLALLDLPPGTSLTAEDLLERYHPGDRDRLGAAVQGALEGGESFDVETRVLTDDGEVRWMRTIGEPVQGDDGVTALRGAMQDVTDRKRRELALESLYDATRELLAAETEADVAEVVVDAAEEVLETPCAAVYLLADGGRTLDPAAVTPGFVEVCGGAPPVAAGDSGSQLWSAFLDAETTIVDDPEEAVFGDDVGGALVVPLGDHGALVTATSGSSIPAPTRRLAETLAATGEAAFDRLESEAALRERDAELEAQNRRLRRQMSINDIIRGIDATLIRADSREEIESSVTERLVEGDDIAFAWIGEPAADGERLVPREWDGEGQAYLDEASLSVEAPADPAVTAFETDAATVVPNVAEGLRAEPWRRAALAAGFHSAVSVPLSFDGYTYGVLTVYAGEPDAFGDLERTVFAELGESIAGAINAVETRRALQGDRFVELTLRFGESDALLARIARETGADVAFEGVTGDADEGARLFFSTDGVDPEAVSESLEELVAVTEAQLLGGKGGRSLFEATVSEDVLVSRLVRHGASPRSIRTSDGTLEVVVDVPPTTDVREFVEMLSAEHSTVELAGRRNVQREVHTRPELVSTLLDGLTDRQQEVLQTAYHAGFFEWPRESTGEEVADLLGVSQPTVNRHLRLAQARLLEQLFEPQPED